MKTVYYLETKMYSKKKKKTYPFEGGEKEKIRRGEKEKSPSRALKSSQIPPFGTTALEFVELPSL